VYIIFYPDKAIKIEVIRWNVKAPLVDSLFVVVYLNGKYLHSCPPPLLLNRSRSLTQSAYGPSIIGLIYYLYILGAQQTYLEYSNHKI
jgi:hypothetical protein